MAHRCFILLCLCVYGLEQNGHLNNCCPFLISVFVLFFVTEKKKYVNKKVFNSWSFRLPCLSFVNVNQFLCVFHSVFGFKSGMWDLIVLVPGHCPSFHFRDIG